VGLVEVDPMGFSVSGSAAIIFAGMFIAFGMFYTATANSVEQVSDARQAASEDRLEQQNTAIEITSAVIDIDEGELQVTVENTGSRALSLEDTDVFVDGSYRTDWQGPATVGPDDDGSTDLWLPEEALVANFSLGSADRVKVVTESGVSDTSGVTST
jgi:flagellar protein FlaF